MKYLLDTNICIYLIKRQPGSVMYDLQLAGQAKYHDLTLVTNNMREFERVADLKIENWVE